MTSPLDDLLRVQQTTLGLRAHRQEILASNIANADTPNFKARDMDFQSALKNALGGSAGTAGTLPLARTSSGHMEAAVSSAVDSGLLYRTETQSSVDGNTVNMDTERAQFAQNTLQYETSLAVVNHLLRDMQNAIQG
ncbi:MAG: flagellar basal body rod protein FlgB [Rhodocyclaceae bacterium]|nr:flagellar basal body rod protein FlgB [Rhodocyclaceae bacterium]